MKHVAASLPTPGSSKVSRIQLTVAADLKRTCGSGGNGGGDGGVGGSGAHGRHVHPTNTVDSGSGIIQGRVDTALTNTTRISFLTLRVGENTRDVLRNVALPILHGTRDRKSVVYHEV